MMGKREAVKAILDGKPADRIPMIMNIVSLSAARYNYGMPDIMMSPQKFAECCIGTRRKLGYDGLCAGLMVGHVSQVAGHLPNKEGVVTGAAEEVIHCEEDIAKMKPFNIDECMNLKGILATSAIMRQQEPDEPQYVIMFPPTGMAFNLLGAKPAFKAMVKNPELFKKTAEACEDIVFELAKAIWEAGVEFLWFPEPNFGGYCISRKAYERCISESNIRFFNRLKDAGIKFIIHTCGLYDDRFDLVLKESADGWHISDTVTKKVVDEYGEQVAIMGNIPCVPVLMEGTKEKIFDYVYNDCIDGAKYGKFILSGDCDVAPPTPDENIIEAVRARDAAEKALFG